jgi:hypothetical protein
MQVMIYMHEYMMFKHFLFMEINPYVIIYLFDALNYKCRVELFLFMHKEIMKIIACFIKVILHLFQLSVGIYLL